MNPGAPPETPRARDLLLTSLLMFFGPKWTPKWSKQRSTKYVICACFVDTFFLRLLNEKWSLVVYFWHSVWGFSQLWEIMKMMLPCKREHQFRGPRHPTSIQNSLKNDTKNRSGKITVFDRFGLPVGSILASKKPLKNDTKTWPTKEREARFILRSLATNISKRKRHDTTQLDTTRTLVNTHVPPGGSFRPGRPRIAQDGPG